MSLFAKIADWFLCMKGRCYRSGTGDIFVRYTRFHEAYGFSQRDLPVANPEEYKEDFEEVKFKIKNDKAIIIR